MIKNIKYIAVLALGVLACEPEFDNPIEDAGTYTSGQADFSNYVALGNSLTAGFADGALYITGQENSYPNILSTRFAFAGGGEFTQPLMADNAGGFDGTPAVEQRFPRRLVLAFNADGTPSGPSVYTGAPATTPFGANLGGSFNNMGIPGARVYHLVTEAAGYGNPAGLATDPPVANPYFVRLASSPNAAVIDDAVAQNPTFFSLWIGNNDILGYATSGGVGVDHNETGNVVPATYSGNDITNNLVFAGAYTELVTKLVEGGTEGVLLNLPDVTSLPFFTTVPYNPIPLDEVTARATNMAYAAYNGGLQQAVAFGAISAEEASKRTINFVPGQNAVVILDEDLTDLTGLNPNLANFRQATPDDLLVLTSSALIGTLVDPSDPTSVLGVGVPLDDQYVLTPQEQAAVENARLSFNATIKALAEANNLAFYDVAADLSQAANGGIAFDGGVITSQFVAGGGFSLDGVHPTPRGHALVTNGILDVISVKYGVNVPKVNVADYGTVTISNEVN
ncbi:G-D-S-L family lipolytic protein [Aquimarina sp. U1-2]|nr:G-D-S-L family lipolytic protein [Aquimarina sp. U1-2]MBP2832471.1 G-D-S-L family lipolytic protein [Aquimarina sp. U1-2]